MPDTLARTELRAASDAADRLVAEIDRIPAVTERSERVFAELRKTMEAGEKR